MKDYISRSSVLKAAFCSRVFFMSMKPAFTRKAGTSLCWFPISTTNFEKDLKQESRIIPSTCSFSSIILLFSIIWQYLTAQAEPMDLPHRTTFLTPNFYISFSTTALTSYFSLAPKEITSPSELPQPLKSKEQKVTPNLRMSSTWIRP